MLQREALPRLWRERGYLMGLAVAPKACWYYMSAAHMGTVRLHWSVSRRATNAYLNTPGDVWCSSLMSNVLGYPSCCVFISWLASG